MAALGGARRALATCLRLRPLASSSPPPAFARLSRRKLPSNISRIPVELGCVQSLMPLHSATASALLTSMLSSKSGNWAWLSEGFATPL